MLARRRWKVELVRRLYDQGRDRRYVIDLFRFIDWIMRLPDGLDKGLWEEISRIEEERSMPYVTSTDVASRVEGAELRPPL